MRSALHVAPRLDGLGRLAGQIEPLIVECERVSRQLRGWAQSLQDGDIKGQRFLNEGTRAEWDRSRRSAAFLEKLQGMTAAARRAAQGEAAGEDEGEAKSGI